MHLPALHLMCCVALCLKKNTSYVITQPNRPKTFCIIPCRTVSPTPYFAAQSFVCMQCRPASQSNPWLFHLQAVTRHQSPARPQPHQHSQHDMPQLHAVPHSMGVVKGPHGQHAQPHGHGRHGGIGKVMAGLLPAELVLLGQLGQDLAMRGMLALAPATPVACTWQPRPTGPPTHEHGAVGNHPPPLFTNPTFVSSPMRHPPRAATAHSMPVVGRAMGSGVECDPTGLMALARQSGFSVVGSYSAVAATRDNPLFGHKDSEHHAKKGVKGHARVSVPLELALQDLMDDNDWA